MKRKRFYKAKDMEWIQPIPKGYLMACCDCNLVHRMDFRTITSENKKYQIVQFRATRARNHTSALRKKNKIRLVVK